MKRNIGYFLIKWYIPSILIVVASFVSFWVPVTAYPAQITLVITALLALITQQRQSSEVNASYAIAINVWMTVCIAFVFGTLFEFAFSNAYHENKVDPISDKKKDKDKKKDDDKMKKEQNGRENPTFQITDCEIELRNANNRNRLSPQKSEAERKKCNRNSSFVEIIKAKDSYRPNNAIDIMSRYIFFSSFGLFIMFYIIYILV